MRKRNVVSFLLIIFMLASMVPYGVSLAAPPKVELSKKSITMNKKESYKLKLKGAKSKNVKWSSSNTKIATVKKGVVKAKKKGKCTVIAKYRSKKYKCVVRVKENKKTATATASPEPVTPPVTETSPEPKATPVVETSPEPVTNSAIDRVKLEVNAVSQDTKVITYTITNNSYENIGILLLSLEKYDGEKWQAVERKDNWVRLECMVIFPNEQAVETLALSRDFVDVSSGNYRLGIQTSCGNVYAEFTID